jgi:hypothetical protein
VGGDFTYLTETGTSPIEIRLDNDDIETEGRNDRLKRATVSQKSDDREDELFRLVQAVECSAGRLAEGAPAPFTLVAALSLAVDHDVPFTFACVSAAPFVVTELLVRVHVWSPPADLGHQQGCRGTRFLSTQLLSTVAWGTTL